MLSHHTVVRTVKVLRNRVSIVRVEIPIGESSRLGCEVIGDHGPPALTGAIAPMFSSTGWTKTAMVAFRKANSAVQSRADPPDVAEVTIAVFVSVVAVVSVATRLADGPARDSHSAGVVHLGATVNRVFAAVPVWLVEDAETTVLHGCEEDLVPPIEARRRGREVGRISGVANRDHLGREAGVRPVIVECTQSS